MVAKGRHSLEGGARVAVVVDEASGRNPVTTDLGEAAGCPWNEVIDPRLVGCSEKVCDRQPEPGLAATDFVIGIDRCKCLRERGVVLGVAVES